MAAFFGDKEEELAAAWARIAQASSSTADASTGAAASTASSPALEADAEQQAGVAQALRELRGELQELRKFVALCYIAVVKAAKKRNRHLRVSAGGALSFD